MDEIKEYKIDEWKSEGKRRFGNNIKNWRFRCPSCGNIQSIADFDQYKDKGVNPNTAFYSCIGRWNGHMKNGIGSGKSPCNYTLGGFLNFAKVYVTDEDGIRHPVFDFDEVIDGD